MRPTWWEVVVIAVLLAGVGIFLWPAMSTSPPAKLAVCISNLHQIWLAMSVYAHRYDGRYPDSFGVLLKDGYFISTKLLLCPASGNKVPEDFPKENFEQADLRALNRVDEWSDYVMVKGLRHAGRKDVIVLYEKPGHHKASGRCCFFDDGHLERLSEAEFQERMKAQEAKLQKEAETPPGIHGP